MQIIQNPSPNFDARPDGVMPDMLIMHYTDMLSAEESLARLRDPAAGVSSHYLVDEDGAIYQLVPDHLRAFHAGQSSWGSRQGINAYSIGIEIQNPGHTNGYRDFPAAQIEALKKLSLDLIERYKIPASHVLGHSDIAPLRKIDPGEKFPWQDLAGQKIGLWPPYLGYQTTPDRAAQALEEIGYVQPTNEIELSKIVFAFQQHYLPQHLTGQLDPQTCSRIQDVVQYLKGL